MFFLKSELLEESNRSFTDLVKLVILEVPKLSEREEGGVWPWLKLFTCTEREQYETLGRRYPEVEMAVRVLKELSLIGRIRMLAEARELQRRDNQAALEYDLMEARERSLKEGLEKGLEQGITQGLEQGLRQSRLEIARRMKTEGVSAEQITRFTGLFPEDIADL